MSAAVEDLVMRYLDRDLLESEGTPTQYTCTGGSRQTAIVPGLSGKTNLDGALIRWDTGNNADENQWSWVEVWTDGTDTLEFYNQLPYTVENTDQFTMFRGGKFMSDQRIPGLAPNDWDMTPTNCTGIEFVSAAYINGEGSGTLKIYVGGGSPATIEATWTPPGESEGARVDISGLSLNEEFALVGGGASTVQKSKYVLMKRNASALPVGDVSDTIVLTRPENIFARTFSGDETEAGITIYRPIGLINAGSATIYNISAWLQNPFTGVSSSTVAAGSPGGIGTGADTLEVTDATGWPNACWIGKLDGSGAVVDVRYCYDKSGNQYAVMNPAGGMRGYTAAAWAAGATIIPLPYIDIGLDAPLRMGSPDMNLFEDPATEETAPASVTFETPLDDDNSLSIGNLETNEVYCIWERYVIPAGMQPAANALARVRTKFEVQT